MEAFVHDVDEGKKIQTVLSSFEDALNTYEFTWAIKGASEKR